MNIPETLVSSLIAHTGRPSDHSDRRAWLNALPPAGRTRAARSLDNMVAARRDTAVWAPCPVESRADARYWFDLCLRSTIPHRNVDDMTPRQRVEEAVSDDYEYLAPSHQYRLHGDGMILRDGERETLTTWQDMADAGRAAQRILQVPAGEV